MDRIAARVEGGVGLLAGGLTLVGVSVAVARAIGGTFSVGDVTVFLAATLGLHAIIIGASSSAARAYEALLVFDNYLAVVNEPVPPTGGAIAGPLRNAVEFHDVWFRYAEHLPWVLRGVSFRLPAGAGVGLVGLNGAGKSTIVKLLSRMYEPQRGSITWDGVDVRDLDPTGLRDRISAVFQDFMAYDFSAADNIGVGFLPALGDRDRITAGRAGRRCRRHDRPPAARLRHDAHPHLRRRRGRGVAVRWTVAAARTGPGLPPDGGGPVDSGRTQLRPGRRRRGGAAAPAGPAAPGSVEPDDLAPAQRLSQL